MVGVHADSKSGWGSDLGALFLAEARKLMSEEHKALGYRPPPESLAAAAQAAAAKHPYANAGVSAAVLTKAALLDAKKIEYANYPRQVTIIAVSHSCSSGEHDK